MDHGAFDETDTLYEAGDAGPNLDGIDGLEVAGELVEVRDVALNDGRHRHFGRRKGRRRILAGSESEIAGD